MKYAFVARTLKQSIRAFVYIKGLDLSFFIMPFYGRFLFSVSLAYDMEVHTEPDIRPLFMPTHLLYFCAVIRIDLCNHASSCVCK